MALVAPAATDTLGWLEREPTSQNATKRGPRGRLTTRGAMIRAAWIGLLMAATNARAEGTDTGATLTIQEAQSGEIAFSGPNELFTHRFTMLARTADLVTVIDVRVPDFTDGSGKQIPIRWSWVGPAPKTIDLSTSAAILIESSLPIPATYNSMIEVVYSTKDAAGKESLKPLRVPFRFERTAPPTLRTELPVTGAEGDTIEATTIWGSATADIVLALRGGDGKPVIVDTATLVTAPRKGTGTQLFESTAVATVKKGLPTEVPRDEVRKVEVEVSVFDGPGAYEGKMLFINSTTGATKEISFTVLVRRNIAVALALLAFGVCVSWRIRAWLQKDLGLARVRRELGLLRDALSQIRIVALGDSERHAADKCVDRISELFRAIDDAKDATELDLAVTRLWKRVILLQSVVEARNTVALIPSNDRFALSLELESIAGALTRDLDETELKAARDKVQALDLEKALLAAVTALASTLSARLNERSAAHPEVHAHWDEIRAYVTTASTSLEHGHVLEARGSLAAGYRMFTKELGTLLRGLAAVPPPHIEEPSWQSILVELERILDQLNNAGDAEAAAKLHARALTQFLQAAAPALAAAAHAEAKERPAAKSEFEAVATRAAALLAQAQPDADDVYRAILSDYARLVDKTPKAGPAGGIQLAGAPRATAVAHQKVVQTEVDAQLAALGAVLPSTGILTARIRVPSRVVDFVLFLLAVLTGLQILWGGNATWGRCGDLLATFLWGAGVYSVGQTVARGLHGLRTDILKIT